MEIEEGAFASCTKLMSVSLSDTLSVIGSYAFSDCYALSQIIIPATVEHIGNDAFWGSYQLTICCEASVVPDGFAVNWNHSKCPVVWGYHA